MALEAWAAMQGTAVTAVTAVTLIIIRAQAIMSALMVVPVETVAPAEMLAPEVQLDLKHFRFSKKQFLLRTKPQTVAALLHLLAMAAMVEEVPQVALAAMVAEAVMVGMAFTLAEFMARLVVVEVALVLVVMQVMVA
jgi:hypothetical protein